MRDAPPEALDLIREFEGLRLAPYRDSAGFWTTGYGHLLTRDRNATADQFPEITEAQADEFLAADAAKAARSVCRLITAPLTDAQFSALVDFCFNLGGGQLEVSTLRKVINRGDMADAPEQFMRWVYAGGQKLPGLIRRRAREAEMWAA